MPTELDEVAVVEQIGNTAGAVSPFWRPEYDGVIVGTDPPNAMASEDAVTVTGAFVIVSVPL